jgi:hypothetical protein
VSYLDIPMYSCTAQLYTSQIILMEGSNCIQTLIQRKPVCPTWNNGNAVYALQNSTATAAEVVPGRNNTQWAITDEGRIWAPSCGACQTTGSNVCLADVLPIELLDFKVRSDNGSHFVEWQTASEINNDYFTLEHSIDGEDFNDLTHIPGAGNSSALLEYSYANQHTVQGDNYYRLRQTDFDGTTSHSEIIVVNESSIENFSLSPNPVQSSLLISLKDFNGQNTEMRIINSLGQLIYSHSVSDAQVQMDVSQFPEGFYFLEIQSDKQSSVKRFLKN